MSRKKNALWESATHSGRQVRLTSTYLINRYIESPATMAVLRESPLLAASASVVEMAENQ
jgi:hypothetical protein